MNQEEQAKARGAGFRKGINLSEKLFLDQEKLVLGFVSSSLITDYSLPGGNKVSCSPIPQHPATASHQRADHDQTHDSNRNSDEQ